MTTSVYVHFPWCLQKCPYCDFASASIPRELVPHEAYADAVIAELEHRRAQPANGKLASVFFGGGTPSLWQAGSLGRVLAAVRSSFASEAAELEITVECNPTSLDGGHAAALREQGVNRLSLGVQSLQGKQLQYLGRLHDADTALRSFRQAQVQMPRVSADLMFGMPGQRAADLLDELSRLCDLGLDHLSLYALTIEPATQFGELKRKGRLQVARDDDYAECFTRAETFLERQGFEHYEVSNYARKAQRSVHNAHYWRGGDYLGLGAGAVGCLSRGVGKARRYRNQPKPEPYMAATRAEGELEVQQESLDAQDILRERLMLGLRTLDGMDVQAAAERCGVDPMQGRERAVERAEAAGHLQVDERRWCVPRRRWLHLDAIVSDLF